MTTETPTVHADLAYLKALVDDGERHLADFGRAYCIAGLVYGIQVALQWLAYIDVLPIEDTPIYLAVVTLPTVALIVALTWKRRKKGPASPAGRAINAVFQGAGLANLVVLLAIAVAARGQGAPAMILIYASVVYALQGACWFVVWRLKRRLWLLAVALAWFGSGVGAGFALGASNIDAFIAIAAVDMLVLMALPGAAMMHLARKASP